MRPRRAAGCWSWLQYSAAALPPRKLVTTLTMAPSARGISMLSAATRKALCPTSSLRRLSIEMARYIARERTETATSRRHQCGRSSWKKRAQSNLAAAAVGVGASSRSREPRAASPAA